MSNQTTTTTVAAVRRNANRRRPVTVTKVTETTQTPKKRNPRKQKRNRRPTILPNIHGVAKCTEDYAVCLVDPFGAKETMPCIPDNIVLPSHKFQSKSRGVFSTGTQGTGFVIFDPFAMAWNDPIVAGTNVSASVLYTTSAYAGLGIVNYAPVGGLLPVGVNFAANNSVFPRNFLSDQQRQMRLVAAGIKIRFVGSSFRNQGFVTLAKSQGNQNFQNGLTSQNFLQDNYNDMVPVSRKSEYVFYTPDTQTFLSYAPVTSYISTQGGTSHYGICIMIDGADTTVPQSFTFEAVAYYELLGSNLTLSPSHSDIQNMGHVMEALPTKVPTASPMETARSVLGNLTNSLYSLYNANSGRINQALISYAMGRINGAIPQSRISYDIPD